MDPLPARLDDLIDYVVANSPEGDALDHLSTAVTTAEQLGEVADHLIGHFVDQARRAGASWTDIGQSMGVTKQAAQKRFVPRSGAGPEALGGGLLARFTLRARNVAARAQDHARLAGHDQVGTEHIVLALLDEPEGLAAKAIEAQDVTLDAVRDAATARLRPPTDAVPDHIPYGRDAKKVVDLTVREALRLNHNYVGTEHILLALLRASDTPGAQILLDEGVDRARAEQWLRRQLAKMTGDAPRNE
jgi:Clp amino terminal domain, pathogenicity island component